MVSPHDASWSAGQPLTGGRLRARADLLAKRVIDAAGAAILVVLLAPLMVLVAVAIKLDSRGPVLFHQERVGARRRVGATAIEWQRTAFEVHKFRSMFTGADESVHRDYTRAFVEGTVPESDNPRSKYKLTGDTRVTRVGRILRRTSVDELPQLFNVLAGQMSLVGPRPLPVYEVAEHEPWQMERLHAIPGITGYWQVYGRGTVPFEEMMRMDIHYVRNRTFWLDLKLLAMTIPAVISGKGAR